MKLIYVFSHHFLIFLRLLSKRHKNQRRRWIECFRNPRCFHHLFLFFWVKLDENPMFKTRDLKLHIKWLAGKMSEPDGTCLKNTPFHCGNLRSSCTSTSTTLPKKGGVAHYSCGRSAVGAKSQAGSTRLHVSVIGW